MKSNIKPFIGLCFALFFFSCSSETFEEKMLGLWDIKEVSYSDCTMPDDNSVNIFNDGCTIEDGETWCIQLEITASAATIIRTSDGEVEREAFDSYTLDDVNETITLCNSGDCATSSKVDDVIVLSEDDGDCIFTLKFVKT